MKHLLLKAILKFCTNKKLFNIFLLIRLNVSYKLIFPPAELIAQVGCRESDFSSPDNVSAFLSSQKISNKALIFTIKLVSFLLYFLAI